MAVLFAKSYVAALSENVKRGNKYAWEKGLWTGKPPIGYKKALLDNGKHTFVIDESKAYYIKEIFNLYAHSSYSLKKLERKCKEWGLISNKTISNEPITKNTIDKILRNPFYYGEMYIKKYDKYYKHNYKPIIERWLFEKCKSVMQSKSEQGKKQSIQSSNNGEEKHIFSGLLTCAVTGRKISPDVKKGRHNNGVMYNYLMTWNPDDITKKIAVREEDILEQVKEVFKSISITNEKLLNEMTEYLQSSNKKEAERHKTQMEELNKRAFEIDDEENRLIKMMMKQSITEEKFDKMNKELEKEKYELNIKREELQKADKSAKTHIITAFQLITNAYKLFEISKNEEKNQLLRFIFSKRELRGKTLVFTLRKPFDKLVDINTSPMWRWTSNIGNIALSDGNIFISQFPDNMGKYRENFQNK